jgi:hypothetical protein
MEQPSVVAKRLGLPTMTRLFGDRKRKMLQFSSDDRERELLKEAEDSFCFPIMEEELTNESVDEILTHAQDLSMKSFIACRAAQRRCRRDLRSHQLAEQTTASALEKEIAVVKQLQDQKEVLARSIACEEEKNSLPSSSMRRRPKWRTCGVWLLRPKMRRNVPRSLRRSLRS